MWRNVQFSHSGLKKVVRDSGFLDGSLLEEMATDLSATLTDKKY